MGWPDRTLRGTKKPQAAWRPAAILVSKFDRYRKPTLPGG